MAEIGEQITLPETVLVACPIADTKYDLVSVRSHCDTCEHCAGLVEVLGNPKALPQRRYQILCKAEPMQRQLYGSVKD